MPDTANQPITHHSSLDRNWSDYYKAVQGRPPRETLVLALDLFDRQPSPETQRFAIDLGCGDGRDTVEILRRGWRVLAIDAEADAIARLCSRPDITLTPLETQINRFETLTDLPPADLINASFCLQFCPQDQFPQFWAKVITALRPGGRFAGQLIGDRDSWTQYANFSYHTRSQVESLLAPFEIEYFEEEEHPGKTALGEEKYWHLFQIVAHKRTVN